MPKVALPLQYLNGGVPRAPRSGRVLDELGEAMAVRRLEACTWEEVGALEGGRTVALLPVGALEAHGPHLPLSTDTVIAEGMVEAAAARLAERGLEVLVLPALSYTAAGFAAAFPGTIDIRPETVTALLVDVAASLGRHGVAVLGVASAHLDPAHLASLHAAREEAGRAGHPPIAFPDLTRKPWALRLGEEFRTGACHAGRFEGSLVMALRPELVREEVRAGLPANPSSLSRAIGEGLSTFEEAGGPRAYFGWPADATPAEGEERVEALGRILEEAVAAELERGEEGA
ncbi:MAG TPA: creatininase family protein [Gemmatimonadota bacterium]|nr:creatininase family protein [Gemmatimonadota bacterium]